MTREFCTLATHPLFQFGDECRTPFGPDGEALLGSQAVDVALDVEQQINRLTASKAIGEIGGAVFPRRALAAMSASTKNLRRAWLQQSASITSLGLRSGR